MSNKMETIDLANEMDVVSDTTSTNTEVRDPESGTTTKKKNKSADTMKKNKANSLRQAIDSSENKTMMFLGITFCIMVIIVIASVVGVLASNKDKNDADIVNSGTPQDDDASSDAVPTSPPTKEECPCFDAADLHFLLSQSLAVTTCHEFDTGDSSLDEIGPSFFLNLEDDTRFIATPNSCSAGPSDAMKGMEGISEEQYFDCEDILRTACDNKEEVVVEAAECPCFEAADLDGSDAGVCNFFNTGNTYVRLEDERYFVISPDSCSGKDIDLQEGLTAGQSDACKVLLEAKCNE